MISFIRFIASIVLFSALIQCTGLDQQDIEYEPRTDKRLLEAVLESDQLNEELNGRSASIWKLGVITNEKQFQNVKELSGFAVNSPAPYTQGYTDVVITINEIKKVNSTYQVTMMIFESPIIRFEDQIQKRAEIRVIVDTSLKVVDWRSKTVEFNGMIKSVKRKEN